MICRRVIMWEIFTFYNYWDDETVHIFLDIWNPFMYPFMYFVYNSMATYLSKHSFVCFNNFKPLCIWSVSKNIYDGLLISSWMKKMQVLNYMKKININHLHFWITFSLIEYSPLAEKTRSEKNLTQTYNIDSGPPHFSKQDSCNSPNPFIAFLNASASLSALKFSAGFTVGSSC